MKYEYKKVIVTCLSQWLVANRRQFCVGMMLVGVSVCLTFRADAQDNGVCAKVGLRLDQTAVMTRTAFRATLELNNHDSGSALTAVGAQVQIWDAGGQLANRLFQIEPPSLESIDRVDGNGTIVANGKATIRWLLVPSDQAAPSTATEFFVGGQFSYTLNGIHVQIPLEGVKITVYPDAALDLTYFHQRDVFSDDPFTPVIEPAQPYSLVLRIRNGGAGAAKNLKISSGEPQIVSNDKGLLIDFALVGVALDGTNIGNTLALDFGRIEPGAIKTAEWKFTSSLQGFFQHFRATFQHQDNLGEIRLSTIKSVSIHEMEHIVYAGDEFADGKPDYLVNDLSDPNRLPDRLYLSDGSTQAVLVVQQAFTSGPPPSISNPMVQVIVTMPPGWTYVRVPEPSTGHLRLSRVQRYDGAEIAIGTNVWVTDRTFVGFGQPPVREHVLHLLDYNSSGIYTLFYTENTNDATDSTAPSSAVTSLPAQTPELFAVSWSGQDNSGGSGLLYFDIFVSSNGGPFQVWLPQTTLRGSMFAGTRGSTYAFYSLASDQAGNREQPPGGVDAQTTVNLVNTAPVLATVPGVTIDEGETLALTLSAADADVPANNLTVSLAPGAPQGITINPNSGVISWATGEAHGPSTNVVTVRVTDNGVPSLTTSTQITIVVKELNASPVLASIRDIVANEGHTVTVTNRAADSDLPAQQLTFGLGPGAPQGAFIDPGTGLFTWTPAEFHGGSTNRIAIFVADNGPGMLRATQTFNVLVRDTRHDFALRAGSTNVYAGASNAIPLFVTSGADLRNVSFLLDVPESKLRSLTLSSLAQEIGSAEILPEGSERSRVRFAAKANEELLGAKTLGYLGFLATTNEHSAVVPVRISQVTGARPAGLALRAPDTTARIFVIGREPIVDASIASNAFRSLTVYGHTNRRYAVEIATELLPTPNWQRVEEVDLSSPFQTIAISASVGAVFYRIYEVGDLTAAMTIADQGTSILIEWSSDCTGCVLEEASGTSFNWSAATSQPQAIAGRYRVTIPKTSGVRFYRLRREGQ